MSTADTQPAVDKPVHKPPARALARQAAGQPPRAISPPVDNRVEKSARADGRKAVLLLRLEGPLQSWGIRARWEVRDTAPEPTKSGLLGLLGCALGYRMGDPRLEELDRGLRFGVRVESPGRVAEDYQTITGFLPAADGRYRQAGVTTSASLEYLARRPGARPATLLSPRCYLEDAAFLVALEETGGVPGMLARCAAALRAPRWPLYLGRKACIPTRPVFEALVSDYQGIEEALQRHPWCWQGAAARPRPAPARLPISVEDPMGRQVRQDALRVNAARLYAFRAVRALAPVPPTSVGGETG